MTTPSFKELIKTLMLANLSYIDQVQEITRVIGYPQVTFIGGTSEGKDTQLYLLHEARQLFVIFRGTNSSQDFINDMQGVVWDSITFDPTLKVHRGFHSQYKAIENQLVSYLTSNVHKYDEVIFCGHSLGGALATIATVYYHYGTSDPNNKAVVRHNKTVKALTYGCPRLGDAAFGQYYAGCVKPNNHWRVFNQNDPAPQFPCQTAIFNTDIYVHVPGNSMCLIGSDPITYQVTQEDNKENLPVDFVSKLDQHHTAVYMNRLLYLHDEAVKQKKPESGCIVC